jgi:hypothetical protein
MSPLSIPQKEWIKMQHFCNDATLFLYYYHEKSYHFVQHKSHMDSRGNQRSLCGEKLTIPVTAEDINIMDKTTSVCVCVCVYRQREKKSHWLKYTATQYRGADKSLARPTSRCILFDGENISFDASLVIYI